MQNRFLMLDGDPGRWDDSWYAGREHRKGRFSLARYLVLLLQAQGARICTDPGEADIILVMGKPEKENELSLIDSNFFMN